MGLRTVAVLSCLVFVGSSCSGEGTDPDTLESITINVTAGDGLLVSVPLHPTDQPFVVTNVEPAVDSGIRAEYLGYVTRCADLCGVHTWDEAVRGRVNAAVEGTVPFEVNAASEGSHLLILLRPTTEARAAMEEGECYLVDGVDLEVDGAEPVRLTRSGFRFMWLLSGEDSACGDMHILQF